LWCAIGLILPVKRAELVLLNGPIDVIGYKEVELAIVVIVEPYCAGRERRIADSGSGGDIGKFPVPRLRKKVIWSNAGNINVFVTIVIIVGRRDSNAVHFHRESC